MRLDAWLKQPHTPVERLRLVERLAQALNGVHDRGETAGSIAPERVEVGADLKVDFSPAARGRPEPGYAAPEQLEGGPPTPASDVYSVGALCWEVLVGRPCGEAPRPLADVAPELPRELANSVMGCLERGAEWRPKDLTYLAQLAAAQQRVSQPQQPAAKPGPKPERAAAPPRQPAPQRPATRRPSRSLLPLVVAAVLLVAAAASSYLWMQRQREPSPAGPAAATPPPAPVAAATPDPVATAAPVRAAAPAPAPSTAPSAAPAAQPTPAATPVPEPTPVEIAAPAPTPTPAPTPLATPTPAASAPAATRAEPAALSTLSPLSVKRPGRVLLDIRGTGLRPDLRVLVTPQKGAARGIAIVRLKWTSASLLNVLIELDASVAPGAYAVALEDAAGNRTNPLQLTITK